MREIKFRAWDKKKKRLSAPFSFKDIRAYDGEVQSIWFDTGNSKDDIEIGNDLGYGDNNNKEMCNRYIFMQYTGLKDSTKWEQLTKDEQQAWLDSGKTEKEWNGKEIYEGDIIRYDLCIAELDGEKHNYCKGIVEFGNGAFVYAKSLRDFWDVEAIGNIYENPELREAT